jgi:hypothetical protein
VGRRLGMPKAMIMASIMMDSAASKFKPLTRKTCILLRKSFPHKCIFSTFVGGQLALCELTQWLA